MSNRNDRSDAALHERLELAEKATQGPWYHTLAAIVGTKKSPEDNDATCICFTEWGCSGDPQANAAHIAASSPDVVRADIEEILRLRAENERLELENQRLSVDGVKDEAYLLTCLDIIRRAVGMPVGSDWQQVAERVERLNREADWFIEYIWNKDIFRCPMPEGYKCEHKLNHICCLDSEETEIRGQCWREAARKAVQEQEATR